MSARLLLALLFSLPALAGPSGVEGARQALQRGETDAAVRMLEAALHDGDIKKRDRALAHVLLGEARLSRADAAEYAGQTGPALRDLRLSALQVGHEALAAAPDAELGFRAQAVVRRARSLLWEQGYATVHDKAGSSVKWWFEGLESREGESLESLSLKAMDQASAGQHAVAARTFAAATRTADQPGSTLHTPRWGLTYVDEAHNLLALQPQAYDPAIAVLERGLAWHARASTELGSEHELALTQVQATLNDARLELLMRAPGRQTEALYAIEASLRAHPKDLSRLLRLAPWLEEHAPDRALNAYVNAQAALPDAARPALLAGALLVRQSELTAAQIRKTTDAGRRQELARLGEGQLRDARGHLERAHALDGDDRDTIDLLVQVCRQLGDTQAAKAWRDKAAGLD